MRNLEGDCRTNNAISDAAKYGRCGLPIDPVTGAELREWMISRASRTTATTSVRLASFYH